MTIRRGWHFMAATALALSVLAGCASPASPEAGPSETPSPTATATPTPTPESTTPALTVPGPLIASSRPDDVLIIQLVDQTGTVAHQGLNNADETVFFTGRCTGTGELDVKISGLGWFRVACGTDAPEVSQTLGAPHVQVFDLTITPPDASTVWAVTLTSGSLE